MTRSYSRLVVALAIATSCSTTTQDTGDLRVDGSVESEVVADVGSTETANLDAADIEVCPGMTFPCDCAWDGKCACSTSVPKCIANSETDCAASAKCVTFGECHVQDGACQATSIDDCVKAKLCKEGTGYCTICSGHCCLPCPNAGEFCDCLGSASTMGPCSE